MAGYKHKSLYDANKKPSTKYNEKHELPPESINRLLDKLNRKQEGSWCKNKAIKRKSKK